MYGIIYNMPARSHEFGIYRIVSPSTLEGLAELIHYSMESGSAVELTTIPDDRHPAPRPKSTWIHFDGDVFSVPDTESQPQQVALGWLGHNALTHGRGDPGQEREWAMVNLTADPPMLVRPSGEPHLWLVPPDAA